MTALSYILLVLQFAFMLIASAYFLHCIKNAKSEKKVTIIDSGQELTNLQKLREISLTIPLSEKTRPTCFSEIIGQEKGIKALKAALCSPNPQHVIIYGPPGVGKTAAARLVLEDAKRLSTSPFKENAAFVEVDATTLQFDERSIADPLIGSVHDPIYQGAGIYGQAGIPQPKAGAVTKAHGGILFLDEIGELHPVQLNKLLKVLEDRTVYFNSSYYNPNDSNIPSHIHDIFKNGLPADFRLISATTRQPHEIPPALRSRCTEIFFKPLKQTEIIEIGENTLKKIDTTADNDVTQLISCYSQNGRDTINVIQTALSLAMLDNRSHIKKEDVEWVLDYGRFARNTKKNIVTKNQVGVVHGLAVYGNGEGSILEIEATCIKTEKGKGTFTVTGIAEEEEIQAINSKIKRNSTARASVTNALTVLQNNTNINISDYIIHLNFPGGMPVDGPSAGIAVYSALFSAIFNRKMKGTVALTGEISIKGRVIPVGGIHSKIEAAIEHGIQKVIIPKENYQKSLESYPIQVIPVSTADEALKEIIADDIKIISTELNKNESFTVVM